MGEGGLNHQVAKSAKKSLGNLPGIGLLGVLRVLAFISYGIVRVG
jgi:hypothetical protein